MKCAVAWHSKVKSLGSRQDGLRWPRRPLLALSGHARTAVQCPLLDNSGQRSIFSRDGLSANERLRSSTLRRLRLRRLCSSSLRRLRLRRLRRNLLALDGRGLDQGLLAPSWHFTELLS